MLPLARKYKHPFWLVQFSSVFGRHYNIRTMRTFVVIALVGLVSVVRPELPHYLYPMSVDTGLSECAEMYEISSCDLKQYIAESFPNQPIVRRLVRCFLINIHAWDDATGLVKHQITAFFKPSPADGCYENRTQVCLNSVPERVDPCDVDSLAYESFQCYYRSYGDLVEGEQFLRNVPSTLEQLYIDTSDLLQVSEETFVEFCKGKFFNNDRFSEFLYAFGIRGGFNVNSGLRLDRLYIQFGNETLLAPETQQCVDNVAAEYCSEDDVTINYQIFVQCLDTIIPIRRQMQEFAKQRVSDPKVCDCSFPQVQVYNVT